MTRVPRLIRLGCCLLSCVAVLAACSTPPDDQPGGTPGPENRAGASGKGAGASGTGAVAGARPPSSAAGSGGSDQPGAGGPSSGSGAGGVAGSASQPAAGGRGGAPSIAGRGGSGAGGAVAAPAAGATGTPGSNIVEFHIVSGTGRQPWPNQSKENPIIVPVGGTLRIINDDPTAKHSLHADGAPCGHGPFEGIKLGGYYDCVIKKPFTTTRRETYDHFEEREPQIVWIKAEAGSTPAPAPAPEGGTGGSQGGSGGTPPSGSGPSFTQLYSSIFGASQQASQSSCAGSACHNPGRSGRVDLSSQANAYTTLKSFVLAGNADQSVLIQRLSSTDEFERMPKGRPALSASDVQLVRDWINAGAKSD